MPYTSAEARQQLADALAQKAPSIAENEFLRNKVINDTLSNPITAAFSSDKDLEKKALGIAAAIEKNKNEVDPEA